MVIVNRSKGQGHAKWLSSRLALVRSYLAPYEGLKSLSDNFESFRTVETVRNVLYNLCLNKSNLIAEFERFLKAYDVLDWNHTKLKEMRSRITQNSMEESMSVLMEGLVTNYYASRLTPEKVEPSPVVSSGGRCDIKVTPLSFSTDEIERLAEKKKTTYLPQVWEFWPVMSMLQAVSRYYFAGLISNSVCRECCRKLTREVVLGCPILLIPTEAAKEWL